MVIIVVFITTNNNYDQRLVKKQPIKPTMVIIVGFVITNSNYDQVLVNKPLTKQSRRNCHMTKHTPQEHARGNTTDLAVALC